jgi:acyl-CoA dehydrogenase
MLPTMPQRFAHLDWPFLEPYQKTLAVELHGWARDHITGDISADVNDACRDYVRAFGSDGWLKHAVGGRDFGGEADAISARSICVIRETLAYHSGLADFAFAMQGLGSGAITLFGDDEQRRNYLPRVVAGDAIAAFALSEPNAGSDAGALECQAWLDGDTYVLNGEKSWISNAGIASFYVVFARTGEAEGARGISAFLVDADTEGLEVGDPVDIIADHPLASLRFKNCRIPAAQKIGEAGKGFKIAMSVLDIFRASVAAAALGFARRALDEALRRSTSRKMFGQTLSDFQITQAKLADMATAIDAAALLTYRAAWLHDHGGRATIEAAMAKMTATESAQCVIDAAVQMFGGLGVTSGNTVERLYREIRPLRIYEGATEVQQLIIARGIIKQFQEEPRD